VTVEEIRRLGQQSAKEHLQEEAENFPYAAHVLRKISPYLTKFFVEHNISANYVSALSILTGIVANITFTFGNYYFMLLGCFLYQLWNLLDLADGETARVTGKRTAAGKYLETINEPITECGFILCLGIGLSKTLKDQTFTILGLTFALAYALITSFARTRDTLIEIFQIKEEIKIQTNSQRPTLKLRIKRLYKKARLLFVVMNAYLILTFLIIIQLFAPSNAHLKLLNLKINPISTYFLLYGLIWIVKVIVTSITNYKRLLTLETLKTEKENIKNK